MSVPKHWLQGKW